LERWVISHDVSRWAGLLRDNLSSDFITRLFWVIIGNAFNEAAKLKKSDYELMVNQ
jgi:hypothetical protein